MVLISENKVLLINSLLMIVPLSLHYILMFNSQVGAGGQNPYNGSTIFLYEYRSLDPANQGEGLFLIRPCYPIFIQEDLGFPSELIISGLIIILMIRVLTKYKIIYKMIP